MSEHYNPNAKTMNLGWALLLKSAGTVIVTWILFALLYQAKMWPLVVLLGLFQGSMLWIALKPTLPFLSPGRLWLFTEIGWIAVFFMLMVGPIILPIIATGPCWPDCTDKLPTIALAQEVGLMVGGITGLLVGFGQWFVLLTGYRVRDFGLLVPVNVVIGAIGVAAVMPDLVRAV